MINKLFATLLTLVLLVGFTGNLNAQPREYKGETPAAAELTAYPLMGGPLNAATMADLAVTPVRLNEAWKGLNFNRKTGRWEYDVLPAGTLVLVDKDGVVRYKQDCGNRLVAETTCPDCATFPAALTPLPATGNAKASGFLSAFGQGLRNFLGGWAPLLGWLLGLLLVALLLTLLALLLAWLWRNFRNLPPAPAPVPLPVTPLPNQGNGDLGLFTRVELTDAGPDGFTVTGYREDGLPRFLGFRQHVEGDRVGGNGRHRISVSSN